MTIRQNTEFGTMSKILWISHTSLSISETFIANTLHMLRSNHEVLALSGGSPDLCAFPNSGVEFTGHASIRESTLEKIRRHAFNTRPFDNRKAEQLKRKVMKRLRTFKPDLVWLCYGTTAFDARLLLEELKVPYVIEVHGYDISSQFADAFYKAGFVSVANKSHAVICASHHTRRLCTVAGVNPTVPTVIRLSLDANRISPKNAQKTTFPSLVHFGRLTDKKQPLATLEAFRICLQQHPDAKFTFIGSGHLREELLDRIAQHNLHESVAVLPGMPQAEAFDFVESQWVFCQHSVTSVDGDQEGFALSPAEAALLELPVVSTNHNGIPEHVIHEKTGLLVNEYDFDGMASAMSELINDEEKRQSFGKAGRCNIASMCSAKKREAKLDQLISKIFKPK